MHMKYKTSEMIALIEKGEFNKSFAQIYSGDENELKQQQQRFINAIKDFEEYFGKDREIALYSAPGRTEIIGNHTDHNNGLAIGAAVNLDIIAIVALNDDNTIKVKSYGFDKTDIVDLGNIQPVEKEKGHSAAVIRGMAAGVLNKNGKVNGFDAYTTSRVLPGSGLSSSAAFEMCLGTIINNEFNDNKFSSLDISLIGQFSENVYFGKPTGVLDQISCATGGAVKIDFADAASPTVEAMPMNLEKHGFKMVITDTKGDHAHLTGDYAAIRSEMESVAQFFGCNVLREVNVSDFEKNIPLIREKCKDRAVLRAMHFFEECRRVEELADAISNEDMDKHLELVLESGHSSFEYNQNAYSTTDLQNQAVSLGLAISQKILHKRGAWRLQGGGFAGTIQAYVPLELLDKYIYSLENVFGKGSCHIISIRNYGGVKIEKENLI